MVTRTARKGTSRTSRVIVEGWHEGWGAKRGAMRSRRPWRTGAQKCEVRLSTALHCPLCGHYVPIRVYHVTSCHAIFFASDDHGSSRDGASSEESRRRRKARQQELDLLLLVETTRTTVPFFQPTRIYRSKHRPRPRGLSCRVVVHCCAAGRLLSMIRSMVMVGWVCWLLSCWLRHRRWER